VRETTSQNSIVASTHKVQRKGNRNHKNNKQQKVQIVYGFIKIVHRIEQIHSRSEQYNKPNEFRDRILQVLI